MLVRCVALALTNVWLLASLSLAADDFVDFQQDIYPLLESKCFRCHMGSDASSGRRLDDREELLGHSTGEVLVIPGKSADSRLIKAVTGQINDLVMPPEGARLTATEITLLKKWIDQGLSWDDSLLPPITARPTHWAFQPIQRPRLPDDVKNHDWPANAIDAFVLARLEQHALSPSLPATRRRLIRRLTLDLLGLPPTRAAIEQFEADPRPDATERLVDELLSSPHYGERWGRHWLDLARWAESEGYESNHPRPFAWRYRDYVIDSFNLDRPFGVFVRQQIAGDELEPYSDENLIATGFLAAARISSNEEDKWLQRNDVLVDVVNATASAFLGVTLNCAQCHNHKFDPLTLRDYYQFQGFFLGGQPANVALRESPHRRDYEARRPAEFEPLFALKIALFERGRQELHAKARAALTPAEAVAYDTPSDQRTAEQELLARKVDLKFQHTQDGIERAIPEADRALYNEVKKKLSALEKAGHTIPQTFAFYSPVTSPFELHVLPQLGFYPLPFDPLELSRARPSIKLRGEVNSLGPNVITRWPAMFDTVFQFDAAQSDGRPLTRRDLADWLTDPRHPLTARVWANRIWQHHFGRGIVETASDFGTKGSAPSHPELLDWLASELIASGWSTKHIHRLILTSRTYQQSAEASRDSHVGDPQNALLSRWNPRRLENESFRDVVLAAASRLDSQIGGSSVPLDQREASHRRSVYLFQKRGAPPEMQALFDGPSEASESCARRYSSTTALQSLYLLNDEFLLENARVLAQHAAARSQDRQLQIADVFARTLGRNPDEAEVDAAEAFFQRIEESGASNDHALVQFCQAILNLNEVAFME